ncbi:hypothetical protein [Fibrella arboris]|uniref:hypothetical protein n=1 Tax=Fibrella arboris TaxID=3242486 RepID=UPI00351F9818
MAKYLFLIGMLIALGGVYLFITPANAAVSRSLMCFGILLEVAGFFLMIRKLIKKKGI